MYDCGAENLICDSQAESGEDSTISSKPIGAEILVSRGTTSSFFSLNLAKWKPLLTSDVLQTRNAVSVSTKTENDRPPSESYNRSDSTLGILLRLTRMDSSEVVGFRLWALDFKQTARLVKGVPSDRKGKSFGGASNPN